ncbi:MAG: PSD1 and planctomycete cytochrome C domain-containing protein [Planctomycetota bacterium]
MRESQSMLKTSSFRFVLLLWIGSQMSLCGNPATAETSDEHARFFESKVRPLLVEHCFECHSGKRQKGGLSLDSLAGMLRGGDSEPAIVLGDPEDSLLIHAVRYDGYEMPPGKRLAAEQVRVLETWVKLGAPWPGTDPTRLREDATRGFSDQDRSWWAIQPVVLPEVPDSESIWVRNPVDQFVLSTMREKGLEPAPEASREVLARRVFFDLTGLPPTIQQLDQFLNDPSPDAYEKLVDRLLESSAYGERFARHWLDVVRYADSDGYRADHTRENAWRYRQYVIDSFNADKPYDVFVREQLAADEMFPDEPQRWIATGFLTHGIYEYNNRDVVGHWDIILNEATDTIGDVFLGAGMQCARCHDHKFDPILQRDYFALRSFIEAMLIDDDGVCASEQTRADHAKKQRQWEEATAEIREQLASLEGPYRDQAVESAVTKFPDSIQPLYRKPPIERSPREHQYAELIQQQVEFEYERLDAKFSKDDKAKILALRQELTQFDALKPNALPTARLVRDVGKTAPTTVIPKRRSEVEPAFLSILNAPRPSDQPCGRSTGRRSQLAGWITDPANPLSTRVIVNRVWQWHFGQGLAPNASDFGVLGGAPDHPELLDWLTRTFVKDGWRLKPLHRLLVTSATYRQSSVHSESSRYTKLDPKNQWYWRSDVRRLDAEQIRDSVLAVSGALDPTGGGRSVSADNRRRSVYTLVKRNTRNPILDAFDLPSFFTSTPRRETTTSPLQSLLLINSQEMLGHSKRLASSVSDFDQATAIETLWRRIYSRLPSASEMDAAKDFLENQSGRYPPASKPIGRAFASSIANQNGSACRMTADGKTVLRTASDPLLKVDEFTIEAIFQVDSVYESGAVRTLASTWNGDRKTGGWSFGVTGKGSRRKPQTLVLHVFGQKGNSKIEEAAIFSDQHLELGRPYYASASIQVAVGEEPGKVEFVLRDLLDVESAVSRVTMEHAIVGGHGGPVLAIGGRVSGRSANFDGLISDIRLSRGAVSEGEELLSGETSADRSLGWWRFHPDALLDDTSRHDFDLRRNVSDTVADPDARALADLCHVLLNSSEFLYVR